MRHSNRAQVRAADGKIAVAVPRSYAIGDSLIGVSFCSARTNQMTTHLTLALDLGGQHRERIGAAQGLRITTDV